MKRTMQQGFTLIELMIVVAIVGILAAVALPAYQDYMVRARASEALSLMSGAKVTVAENAVNGASDLGAGWAAPNPTAAIQSVTINATTGVVTAVLKDKAGGTANANTLTLTPASGGSDAVAAVPGKLADGTTDCAAGSPGCNGGSGAVAAVPASPLAAGTVPTSAIVWSCGGTLNSKYKPASCR
ncbi:pilin [Comamonas aquatica]|uniref:pilin n=1 Tax=Comamonas aquatica TaxID=225991 RepID=UPI001B384FA1|nr:pilin [Comamonas aquatica]QTX20504.1 pilin [Comamonas aquatica]